MRGQSRRRRHIPLVLWKEFDNVRPVWTNNTMDAPSKKEFRQLMQMNLQKELAIRRIEGVRVDVVDINGDLGIQFSGDPTAVEAAKQVLRQFSDMFL